MNLSLLILTADSFIYKKRLIVSDLRPDKSDIKFPIKMTF